MPETQPADVFQLVGTTLEGRFVVEATVAEGGFGVVYRAQQATLERPVALKVLKTPGHFNEAAKQEFLESFAAEAKTIARISHPNIVDVYDFGVSVMPSGERAAWMALEWLTGVTLESELVRRRGRGGMPPAECLALLEPILSALALVHAAGVAHRDIKPANIMVVPSRATRFTPVSAGAKARVLKLLDFGIAKIMEEEEKPGTGRTRTRSDRISFSPGYAAPEQVSHGRTGPWTDVHAMGLILTELLTDRPPFEAEEMAVLFQQIIDRTRPTPRTRGFDVGAWEEVLLRALAVPTAERYRDAGELLSALAATVPEGRAARVGQASDTDPDSGPPPPSPAASTLESMETQVATAPGPSEPALLHVTTATSTARDRSSIQPAAGAGRAPLYVGAALAVVVAIGGWIAVTRLGPRTGGHTPPDAGSQARTVPSGESARPAAVVPSSSATTADSAPSADPSATAIGSVATSASVAPRHIHGPHAVSAAPSAVHSAATVSSALPTRDTMY
jgi:serine/threonine protein kinase